MPPGPALDKFTSATHSVMVPVVSGVLRLCNRMSALEVPPCGRVGVNKNCEHYYKNIHMLYYVSLT